MSFSAEAGEREEMLDRRLAYGLLRLALGVDMLMHGVTRIFFGHGVGGFAAGMVRDFAASPLPGPLVQAFALTLPFGELALGVLLVLGWQARWATALGGLLMVALIFGTALRSEWSTVGLQLGYSLLYSILLAFRRDWDFYSIDGWLSRRHKKHEPASAGSSRPNRQEMI